MGFQKAIEIGKIGQLILKEEGGIAAVELKISEEIGSGVLEGVAKASVSAQVEVDAKHLIHAALELAKVKFPAISALIEGAQAAIDEELSPKAIEMKSQESEVVIEVKEEKEGEVPASSEAQPQ